jgi:trafficking protein particle complex subunit 9
MIMTIYTRTTTAVSADVVPQIVFSECSIRFAKLLSAINLSGGLLNDSCLSHLVLSVPLSASKLSLTRVKSPPTRKEISTLLAGAFPGRAEETNLSPIDSALILAGISSVFSSLGMQRKKAVAMKELLSALIPGLTQAKIIGAAEAGIHPSSGIAAIAQANEVSNSEAEKGLEDVLNVLCQIYGIPEAQWTRSVGSDLLQERNGDDSKPVSNGNLPKELLGSFILRSFGSIQIKIEILRACIQLCEALPDYHGILHYSTTLLRAAGPGTAPSAETTDVLVNIPREEQIQLAAKITRTVEEARTAGFTNVEAEYWDEFLVRGLYLMDSTGPLTLQPHRRVDLKVSKVETQTRDPFIHNPFLEATKTQKWPNLLAAGDDREFVVSLQNPFDFAVEIEYLKLASAEDDLGILKNAFTLKPYRTQSFSITGNLCKSGSITISGCIVKIQGCKERLFPIFSEAWAPRDDVKVKEIGLLKMHNSKSRTSDISISGINEIVDRFPQTAHIPLTVIPEQPLLVITKSSIPEHAIMLLEGEETTVLLTLTNTSSTATADFIHMSYFDSVSTELQRTLSQKGIPPQDMYEMEYQLMRLPSITSERDQPLAIAPLASETFKFKIRAKPGLTSATFQFDYASLRDPHLENEETLFTRKAVYSLSITVNASIQVQRLEIIPLGPNLSTRGKKSMNGASQVKEPVDSHYSSAVDADDEHCLLLVDLRNAWPSPLKSSFHTRNDSIIGLFNKDTASSMTIKPGQVVRQVLTVPKIYIANPYKRIMSLSPSRNRQFVVSTDNISPDTERSIRELFWFREAFLTTLEGSWTTESGLTTGIIDLRSIRMNLRMVEALRLPDVSLSFHVDEKILEQDTKIDFAVQVDEFVTLNTKVRNRSPRSICALLRLQPSLAHQMREVGLDIGKRFAWSGVLQHALPKMMPDQEYTVELPICALCSGEFVINASLEEIQAFTDVDERKNNGADEDLDDLAGPGRRPWIVGQSCRIVARDAL